ncbi:unnamed protein product [Didymodactylos carnosus]|uniref:Uncharacterized protein n=1 Tax=Didymodactylos carnosus TaxID=1234261 RepID=A0A814KQF5_9BILA|nr:unnamed protein product [Didymodactylos carnosus]CAF1182408.1 unnamed protein product [Didymodactylos carnosus]CAF3824385.1 unnamed protein product [Didymodactylos carnosus]CAF3993728.1 unnamed protein product [Didymodactylos carnosus]
MLPCKISILILCFLLFFKHVDNSCNQQSIVASEKVVYVNLKNDLNNLINTFKHKLVAKFASIDNTTITPLLNTFTLMENDLKNITNLSSCLVKQQKLLPQAVKTVTQVRTNIDETKIDPELSNITTIANDTIIFIDTFLFNYTDNNNLTTKSLVDSIHTVRSNINNILTQSLKTVGQLRNIVKKDFGFIFNMFSDIISCIFSINNNKLQIYETLLTSTQEANGLLSSLDGQISSTLGVLQDYSISFGQEALDAVDKTLFKAVNQLIQRIDTLLLI